MTAYDFFRDQGSALGATPSFTAVIVALLIVSWARTDAQRQIRAIERGGALKAQPPIFVSAMVCHGPYTRGYLLWLAI